MAEDRRIEGILKYDVYITEEFREEFKAIWNEMFESGIAAWKDKINDSSVPASSRLGLITVGKQARIFRASLVDKKDGSIKSAVAGYSDAVMALDYISLVVNAPDEDFKKIPEAHRQAVADYITGILPGFNEKFNTNPEEELPQ